KNVALLADRLSPPNAAGEMPVSGTGLICPGVALLGYTVGFARVLPPSAPSRGLPIPPKNRSTLPSRTVRIMAPDHRNRAFRPSVLARQPAEAPCPPHR